MAFLDPTLRLLAFATQKGVRLTAAEAIAWYKNQGKPEADARKALHRLTVEGLAFPLRFGEHAVPSKEAFAHALQLPTSAERLAAWLSIWLDVRSNRRELPEGLDWTQAAFFGLAVDRATNLRWRGPLLSVPIEPDARRLGPIYHRMPIFALDPVFPSEEASGDQHRARVPGNLEVARVLSLHRDPRLREAALLISEPRSDAKKLREAVARTEIPAPFPDPKTRLPMGPPHRYRIFAPRSWVRRDASYSRPGSEEARSRG